MLYNWFKFLPSSTPQPSSTAPPDLLAIGVDSELTADAEIPPDLGTIQSPANPNAVTITLIVRQRTWMRVTVDGEIQFDGRVAPGETLTFTGIDQVELLTGNAAALQVFFNDQDLGILGVLGCSDLEIVQNIILKSLKMNSLMP